MEVTKGTKKMTCRSTNSFPSASEMALQSANQSVVWEEIFMIQQAILAASSQCQIGGGQYCTTIAGNTPMTFVAGISSVTVNSGGTGYVVDTPTIYFIPPVGSVPSVLATGTVLTNGGSILAISITNPGAGYQPVAAKLAISSVTGATAILLPIVNATGQIVGINISNPGFGYTTDDSIIATRAVLPNSAYITATFKITAVSITGAILSIAILNSGNGYQPSVTTLNIVSTLNTSSPYPLGTGFYGTVNTNSTGNILGVIITNTGAGYTPYFPYLVITDPGNGARTLVALGTGSLSSSIESVTVITPGENYTQSATGTVLNPPTASLPNPPISPAEITLNVANNTYGTNPQLYWQVWADTTTNTPIQNQLNSVVSYFQSLGYSIEIQSNPLTGSTIAWRLDW